MYAEDDEFLAALELSKRRSMLTQNRLLVLWNLTKYANGLEGDIAELGCHSGGTSYLMASAMEGKILYAFDSFEGLPELSSQDTINGKFAHGQGSLKTSKDRVVEYLSIFDNVIVYDGWIENTLANVTDKKFSLVYLDMDVYQSTKFAIDFMWKRLVPSGYMIFDDYLWEYTPGIKAAVDEYFGSLFNYNHYFIHPQLGIRKS